MNGVSKKLCLTTNCVSGVLGLAANADDKLPFCLIVAGMLAAFLISQVLLDWFKK